MHARCSENGGLMKRRAQDRFRVEPCKLVAKKLPLDMDDSVGPEGKKSHEWTRQDRERGEPRSLPDRASFCGQPNRRMGFLLRPSMQLLLPLHYVVVVSAP